MKGSLEKKGTDSGGNSGSLGQVEVALAHEGGPLLSRVLRPGEASASNSKGRLKDEQEPAMRMRARKNYLGQGEVRVFSHSFFSVLISFV